MDPRGLLTPKVQHMWPKHNSSSGHTRFGTVSRTHLHPGLNEVLYPKKKEQGALLSLDSLSAPEAAPRGAKGLHPMAIPPPQPFSKAQMAELDSPAGRARRAEATIHSMVKVVHKNSKGYEQLRFLGVYFPKDLINQEG